MAYLTASYFNCNEKFLNNQYANYSLLTYFLPLHRNLYRLVTTTLKTILIRSYLSSFTRLFPRHLFY